MHHLLVEINLVELILYDKKVKEFSSTYKNDFLTENKFDGNRFAIEAKERLMQTGFHLATDNYGLNQSNSSENMVRAPFDNLNVYQIVKFPNSPLVFTFGTANREMMDKAVDSNGNFVWKRVDYFIMAPHNPLNNNFITGEIDSLREIYTDIDKDISAEIVINSVLLHTDPIISTEPQLLPLNPSILNEFKLVHELISIFETGTYNNCSFIPGYQMTADLRKTLKWKNNNICSFLRF